MGGGILDIDGIRLGDAIMFAIQEKRVTAAFCKKMALPFPVFRGCTEFAVVREAAMGADRPPVDSKRKTVRLMRDADVKRLVLKGEIQRFPRRRVEAEGGCRVPRAIGIGL